MINSKSTCYVTNSIAKYFEKCDVRKLFRYRENVFPSLINFFVSFNCGYDETLTSVEQPRSSIYHCRSRVYRAYFVEELGLRESKKRQHRLSKNNVSQRQQYVNTVPRTHAQAETCMCVCVRISMSICMSL